LQPDEEAQDGLLLVVHPYEFDAGAAAGLRRSEDVTNLSDEYQAADSGRWDLEIDDDFVADRKFDVVDFEAGASD